ncbi:uncharacterized protein YbjT (DUF2867 family) [Paraburkholderia sp. JPY419]
MRRGSLAAGMFFVGYVFFELPSNLFSWPAQQARGHTAVAASPATGVNTLTNEGLREALEGCDVVVDLANSPSFEDNAVLAFFEISGRNLFAAEIEAGVRHHVALSVVGTDRLSQSGYFRAKIAQEN